MARFPARTTALLLLVLFSFGGFASAQKKSRPYTPKTGSAERTALMNALRPPIQKRLTKKVMFKVTYLKALNGWAFMKGAPLEADGSPMDYRDTPYAQEYKDGVFSDFVCALWRKRSGKWRLVTYALGPSDVAYSPWWKEYGAPKAIFDYTE